MEDKDNRSLELEDILKEFGEEAPVDELEDILKEFGAEPSAQAPEAAQQPEPEEALPAQETLEEAPEVPAPEEVTGDTIRLDTIQKAVEHIPVTEDTVVFAPLGEDTAAITPVENPVEEVSLPEEWDTEYDAPVSQEMPSPIAFKPKSRLQQLRAKLVAGPEKRYYELAEQGFGKLQVGIFLSLLIFAVSAGATALYALGMVSPERLRLLVFVQLLSMLLAALVGCYRLLDGLGDLLHLRFTLNTWLALTFAVCCVDGVLCLGNQRICCSALFCLEMLMAQIGACQNRRTELMQMDTLRKAAELEALVRCDGYYEEKPGFVTVSGEPEAFMDSYAVPSTPEKVLSWYGFAGLLVSTALGVFAGLRADPATGVQTAAAALLLAMPATVFISQSRPRQLLQKRLHKLGVVLCGWQGIRQSSGKSVYPLTHKDLFPTGTVKLNGMKFLGQFSPDTVVCYAASMAAAEGGSLAGPLHQQLAGRNGQLLPVEDLHRYSGGVSGVINGTPVILGTEEFMTRMGVEMPRNTKAPQTVCLAIDGSPAGMFAVAYSRSKSAAAGLRTLCSYRGLSPVLATPDFVLTNEFLAQKFPAHTSRILQPEQEARPALAEQQPAEDAAVLALLTREGLAPKAFAITGARVLRTSLKLGVVIHMLGGILGLVAAFLLALSGSAQLLTPMNLLLYSIIWMVPGFLVTQWTRVL